jgi:hypothetical protein
MLLLLAVLAYGLAPPSGYSEVVKVALVLIGPVTIPPIVLRIVHSERPSDGVALRLGRIALILLCGIAAVANVAAALSR